MPFSSLTLNDGNKIPQIAFGTGTALYGRDSRDAIILAINTGFTHIDAAQVYNNEASVGDALVDSRLDAKRSELFVTTKLGATDDAVTALKESLRKLKVDYVDLFLIHQPRYHKDLAVVWKSVEESQARRLAKSIGVSNFSVDQLKLLEGSNVVPAVNQIKLDPYNYAERAPVLEYASKHGIIIEAYSSLGPITHTPGGPVDPVIARIAKSKKATPAQVLFLWVAAKGAVIVTTSSNESRLKEYLATGDLEPLTPEEVAKIDAAGAKR